MPVVRSLVLDGEKGELVNSSGRVAKNKGVYEAKNMAALKNHREAERRRRDKINAHLTTLRGLVPCNEKMDKAALLAEVISQVKQLKKTATQASEGLHLPMDTDEVNIEKIEGSDGSFLLRTSLCCEYRPHLLSDLRRAIKNLPVHLTKCEISTLGVRVKTVFLLDITKEVIANSAENQELIITNSVRSTLSNILDKVSALAEYEQQLVFPQKRQRISYLDSSCSSS
ncbi:putative transcription factor bHLH107 [Primulina huaijiensis]|uniref:putative transcription factor bHLH107 n=1 Tax=Primulina huaijiensis TaxID=1492673 RepID=UPI003CC785A8